VEEGGLNDIAAEVLHSRLIFRRDAITAEDLESGMTPVGKHGDQVSGNSPFGQEHLEDPVPEDRLQLFQVQRRSRQRVDGEPDAVNPALMYDTTHEDYVYTKAWVEKLARDLADPAEYERIVGRPPRPATAA
jgi:hypothetical protein